MVPIRANSILNTADAGIQLAEEIMRALKEDDVVLDFRTTERMTPSFANAFVMTILHDWPLETLRERVKMINRNDQVKRAINESVRRYRSGIRLSTQRREHALA